MKRNETKQNKIKCFEHEMYVLIFSIMFFSETFRARKINMRDIINFHMYLCKVNGILVRF